MDLSKGNISNDILNGITGQYLEAFLISFEGWRRGLELTWYKEGYDHCKFNMAADLSGKFFSLRNQNKEHFFYRTRGDYVSNEATSLTRDKEKTKKLLQANNIPVPLGRQFHIDDKKGIIEYANEISYPVVLKPVDAFMGKGVFCDIRSEEELSEVYEHYITAYSYRTCMVEKQYYGEEHRIYVVGDEAVSVINRKSAYVVSDGESSVRELIAKKNESREKNPYLRDKPIKIDYDLEKNLADGGYELDEVYPKGTEIKLRKISNLARGGEPHDVTPTLSDRIKQLAVDSFKAMPNMAHGGVDIIVDENDPDKGVVLEINATAEIVFHMYPITGAPQNIPGKLIDFYFPESNNSSLSKYYYDFNSILRPLKDNIIEKMEVATPPIGEVASKKYEIIGRKANFNFLKTIKSLAVKNNLSGEVTKLSEDRVSVSVYSNEPQRINDFQAKMEKSISKNNVDILESNESRELYKLGFYINR